MAEEEKKQADTEFEANLGCTVRTFQNQTSKPDYCDNAAEQP